MYAAIDAVVDKVARQMRKYKTRLMKKHRPRKDIVQHLEEHVLESEPVEREDGAKRMDCIIRWSGPNVIR